jgi:hypothetical protein
MTHSLTNHDIANLRHQERVALGHAAIHALEAREARSTQREADSAQSMWSWLGRVRWGKSATQRTPARGIN